MAFEDLLIESCTVVHLGQTGTDRGNNPVYGETSADLNVPCRTQQLSAEELTNQRDTAMATHRGFFLTSQSLAWFDRVELADITFEITGPPNIVHDGRGPHHIEVLLRTVTDWGSYP